MNEMTIREVFLADAYEDEIKRLKSSLEEARAEIELLKECNAAWAEKNLPNCEVCHEKAVQVVEAAQHFRSMMTYQDGYCHIMDLHGGPELLAALDELDKEIGK